MNFGIYILSWGNGRADVCQTPKFVSDAIIVTRAKDVPEYEKAFPNHEICGVDFEPTIDDLVHYIKDTFKDDVSCIIHDDLQAVCIYRTMEKVEDPDFIRDKIEDIGQIVYDLGLPLGTTSNDMRPWSRATIFNSLCTPGGINFYNFGVLGDFDLHGNFEEFGLFTDLDIIIKMLAKFRIIFSFNHIIFHFDIQGKNTIAKSYASDIDRCATNMKLKYGKYVSYDPKRKASILKIRR